MKKNCNHSYLRLHVRPCFKPRPPASTMMSVKGIQAAMFMLLPTSFSVAATLVFLMIVCLLATTSFVAIRVAYFATDKLTTFILKSTKKDFVSMKNFGASIIRKIITIQSEMLDEQTSEAILHTSWVDEISSTTSAVSFACGLTKKSSNAKTKSNPPQPIRRSQRIAHRNLSTSVPTLTNNTTSLSTTQTPGHTGQTLRRSPRFAETSSIFTVTSERNIVLEPSNYRHREKSHTSLPTSSGPDSFPSKLPPTKKCNSQQTNLPNEGFAAMHVKSRSASEGITCASII